MLLGRLRAATATSGSMSVKAMTLPTDGRTYRVPEVNIKMIRREYLDTQVGTSAEDDLERSKRCLDIAKVTKWDKTYQSWWFQAQRV